MPSLTKGMKITRKLALAACSFLLPIAFILWSLVSEQNIAIDFAAKEVAGATYLGGLVSLQEKAAAQALGLAGNVLPVAVLPALETAKGNVFDTGRESQATIRAFQQIDALADARAQLRGLIARVGDRSNLILDNVLDTYYLTDVVLNRLPDALDQIADLAAGESDGAATSDQGRVKYLIGLGALIDDLDGLDASMLAAETADGGDAILTALDADYRRLRKNWRDAVEALKAGTLGTAEAGAIINGMARYSEEAAATLHDLLADRVAALQMSRLRVSGVTAVLFCLSISFVLATVVRGVTAPLTRLVAATRSLANGTLETPVPVIDGGNELGDLSRALRLFQTSLVEARDVQIAKQLVTFATASGRIGVWNLDVVTGALVWDELMRGLYALLPEEDVGIYAMWSRRLHPDDRAEAEQAILSAIQHGTPYDTEYRIVWPDASVRHIRAAGRVTRDEAGRPVHMVGVNWDVTEARRLAADLRQQMALQAESVEREILARSERDAAERAAVAKTEFLATMSHEIRSPLSGLLGVLDVLRASPLEADQRRMTDIAHNSASMLLAVLNDVLDFSKIEAGALSVESRPAELRRLLDHLVQPHALAAQHKGLALTLTVDPAAPGWLLTDALRVQQILGNLLSNARKFTNSGEIAVAVTVTGELPPATLRIDTQPATLRIDTQPATLRIDVRDTGIGIDAAALDRLFQPFTQADSSTTRVYGGTGLGLAISQKLAGLMGGSLSVTSEVGVGSVFSLDLPLVACLPADARAGAANVAEPAMTHAGRRALVVDDDSTIRWLSERQLKSLGFDVAAADDGEAALGQFRAASFDLVLTDCHMPRMDGVALTAAIRDTEQGAFARVRIIGLTADVTEAQRARCFAAGMSDLAIKPLTLAGLSTLLAHHFSGDAAPAPAPQTAAALRAVAFDDSIFLAMFEPGDAEGSDWLGHYLATAQGELVALGELVARGADALPDLATASHRLAGTCYSVGAMLAGGAARAMEAAARSGDVAALAPLMAELAAGAAAAEAAIVTFLDRSDEVSAEPSAGQPALHP